MFKPPTCYYSWTVVKDKIFKRYTTPSCYMLTIAAQISVHDKWRDLNITTRLLLSSFQLWIKEKFIQRKHRELSEDIALYEITKFEQEILSKNSLCPLLFIKLCINLLSHVFDKIYKSLLLQMYLYVLLRFLISVCTFLLCTLCFKLSL